MTTDIRSDKEIDKDGPFEAQITVSGDPCGIVQVVRENQYVNIIR